MIGRAGCSASTPVSPGAATPSSTVAGRRRRSAVSLGVIRTPPTDPLPQRLAALRAEFAALIAEFRPDVVAVEQVFFQVNVRTAMSVGQASGLALAEAALAGCEVVQYTPNQVKDAVAGWGGADKEQVQKMVQARLGLATLPQAGRRRRRRGAGAVPPGDGAARGTRVAAVDAAGAQRMIGSLRGSVLERDLDGTVLLEVGGVGYLVDGLAADAGRARAGDAGVPLRPPPHPRGRPDAVRLHVTRRARRRSRC